MISQAKPMTVADFERFVDLPENAEKTFEYIGGEAVEVPVSWYHSVVASRCLGEIYGSIRNEQLWHVTGERGGYMVCGECYVPNVALIAVNRQPRLPGIGYVPNAPDFVVEVFTPYDRERDLRLKIFNYLAAGTVVWAVFPETKTVEVYAPGQPLKILGLDGVLDGGSVLPGFTLAVKEIFPD